MKSKDMYIDGAYLEYYKKNLAKEVYPREWLIRALLGPGLKKILPTSFYGLNVLDIGFGDCRNFKLLKNLGMNIYGTEITKEIVELGEIRCINDKIDAKLLVGWNDYLPYEENYFDIVVASSSLYFIRERYKFIDNIKEVHRVIKPSGLFLCSLVKTGSQILENAIEIGDLCYIVNRNERGLSNGSKITAFAKTCEIEYVFREYFKDINIGVSESNYWGVMDYHYLVAAKCSKW